MSMSTNKIKGVYTFMNVSMNTNIQKYYHNIQNEYQYEYKYEYEYEYE